jgi:hypothetical protein
MLLFVLPLFFKGVTAKELPPAILFSSLSRLYLRHRNNVSTREVGCESEPGEAKGQTIFELCHYIFYEHAPNAAIFFFFK